MLTDGRGPDVGSPAGHAVAAVVVAVAVAVALALALALALIFPYMNFCLDCLDPILYLLTTV